MNYTPILIIGFNRPDYINKLFDVLCIVKPVKIYFSVDGPRVNNFNDKINCELVQNVISRVDWECDIQTNFFEQNFGCKIAVSKAIDWFFENEEFGIILEDDCIPNSTFFTFCETMLFKYKDDSRVGMITGTNYMIKSSDSLEYFFSKHFIIWGWATWRRCWKDFDLNLLNYGKNKERLNLELKNNSKKWYHWIYNLYLFEQILQNKIDTWDIQWVNLCLYNNYLCVTPPMNLISNIGVSGTHATKHTDSHFLKTFEFKVKNLNEPLTFLPNSNYDDFIFKRKYIKPSFRVFLKNYIRNLKLK